MSRRGARGRRGPLRRTALGLAAITLACLPAEVGCAIGSGADGSAVPAHAPASARRDLRATGPVPRPGAFPAPTAEPAIVRDGRYAMGTVLEVTCVARTAAPAGAAQRCAEHVFAEAARLDGLFSRHDPASALTHLNASAGAGAVAVPPELAAILRDALAYAEQTRGAFDVTVGPLVALWTAAGRAGRLPADPALASARARVGRGVLGVDRRGRVRLAPGAAVDLGGLAKGWALDHVALGLGADVDAVLLDFGRSSILARGRPPGAPGWRLLLRGPDAVPLGTVVLRDRALSVSSSLGQWSEIEGRRFGHVIDPRTGWPLRRTAEAVVVSENAALAEALTKALLVLPPEEGLALVAALPGAEALWVGEDGAMRETAGWRTATGFEPFVPEAAASDAPAPG